MKVLKLLFTLLLTVSFMTSFAQREKRNVGSFDEISFGISGNLYLKIGNSTSVELDGDEDDLDEIETEVKDGRLRIRTERSWNWNMGRVDVYITVPSVEGIFLSGSGSVIGESVIKADDLDLSISGSGDMELEIDAEETSMSISGSGDAELEGDTGEFAVRISGSGGIDAYGLDTEDCEVRISGSGSVRVSVSKSLKANIAGSGSVYYEGDPDKVDSSTAGSGRVRKRG